MRAISPLVAVVLLIGLVIAIGGVMFIWLTGFTGETKERISEKAEEHVECVGGIISLENLGYCNATRSLSGVIANRGSIDLKNLSLTIYYVIKPSSLIQLCEIKKRAESCTVGNLTAKVGEIYWFNVSAEPEISEVRVTTHCPPIYDRVRGATIPALC